jgi:hypothetical protein
MGGRTVTPCGRGLLGSWRSSGHFTLGKAGVVGGRGIRGFMEGGGSGSSRAGLGNCHFVHPKRRLCG